MLVKLSLIMLLLIIVLASNCQFYSDVRGPLFDRWETDNKGFKLRISEYQAKKPVFFYDFYYVFESAPTGDSKWSEVMTFKHPDSIPLPSDQVRFVDDRIAYLFMGWMYAVTTDEGRTWSVWDAAKDLPVDNYQFIRDVQLSPDGEGKMMLHSVNTPGAMPELYTRDYGRHWTG